MNTNIANNSHSGKWAVSLSLAASSLLVILWLLYVMYLLTTRVDKQSVYVGPITFWTAILLMSCAVAVSIDLLCLAVAWIKRVSGKELASIAFTAATLLSIVMFYVSGMIVDTKLVALETAVSKLITS
jgi:hypothetical protein